ncbi:MGH1-like glycoside hydrolase domain-containing protein [Sphingobacterium hotanense]|uniref:MGH1-like glycoside hydrolase domain-containing protein n=1 Tax=Sphingobacterium hotanense TaxID=649196 RepID=UPI0011F371EE|nr:trehalase family glycosidase [Sphingobacterium hotanense]
MKFSNEELFVEFLLYVNMKQVFRVFFIALFLKILTIGIFAQTKLPSSINYKNLESSHDVWDSDWGPFSKRYVGISHIASKEKGLRIDFSIIPGYYRNKVYIPNVLFESDYTPWYVSIDGRLITYRYHMGVNEEVYADTTYLRNDESSVYLNLKLVNKSTDPQTMTLDFISHLCFPDQLPKWKIENLKDFQWVNATDYHEMQFSHPRPTDYLVHMGYRRGEIYSGDFLDAKAIGKGFGKNADDFLIYKFDVRDEYQYLGLVYQMEHANTSGEVQISGFVQGDVALKGGEGLQVIYLPISKKGRQELEIRSKGGEPFVINGFFLSRQDPSHPIIVDSIANYIPLSKLHSSEKRLELKYPYVEKTYNINWDFERTKIRTYQHHELDLFFREKIHKHVDFDFIGDQKGHYTNVHLGPILLTPQTDSTIHMIISTDESSKPKKGWPLEFSKHINEIQEFERQRSHERILEAGQDYLPTIERLTATLYSNIVFPIYTSNRFIKHFTPGKNWNSLYTWDSGFIALGLNEVNPELALENINAYTTNSEEQSPFLHHGSPLAIQLYAFFDLWNKSQDKTMLRYLYPRLKRIYDFISGENSKSNTLMPSNLIRTWDYFYNSGGWDDYPAQVAVHKYKLADTVTPVISTAHCIRMAKILRFAALELGFNEDVSTYQRQINEFANAVQKYAWNSSSGYFSYVVHDKMGQPLRHFTDSTGADYNMGLDGAYPLIAGICTPEQEEILLEKMFSSDRMWTASGMSVVDQKNPYYKNDGYWNGAVWMPHQYFVWKTMLDLGRADLAKKIADKALQIYHLETSRSNHTFEHFLAENGRGAGWHHFSGLSMPILSWFHAYFQKGTLTTGFDIWVEQQEFSPTFDSLNAQLFVASSDRHKPQLLVCLNPSHLYQVLLDGKPCFFEQIEPGLLTIRLPEGSGKHRLEIKKRQA